jgi:hypothetical protein
MGILSMKVMGQGMIVGSGAGRASPTELLQFNLSQPVASVVIGCEQMARLEENVQAALNFTPISKSGKKESPRLGQRGRTFYGTMMIRRPFDSKARPF